VIPHVPAGVGRAHLATPVVGWIVNWQRRELIILEPIFNLRAVSAVVVACNYHHTTLPTMNYGKKDEDADTGLVKVDRTQVFQEGESILSIARRFKSAGCQGCEY
jgi:hypothetical protein